MNLKSKQTRTGAADSRWAVFRDLCPKIEALCKIPFRVTDAVGNLIFQSQLPFRKALNTTLALDCRHKNKICFRIICDIDEKDAESALNLMLALRRIGLYSYVAMEKKESLFDEITRNYHLLHFFYTLPSLLAQGYSRKRLCEIGLNRICKALNVQRGSIFFYSTRTRCFQLVAMKGGTILRPELVRMNANILDWVRHQNRSLLIEDVDRFPNFKGVGDYRTRSFLTSPIFSHPSLSKKRIAGVINLADPVGKTTFDSHDLKFASSAATYAVLLAMTKPKISSRNERLHSSGSQENP